MSIFVGFKLKTPVNVREFYKKANVMDLDGVDLGNLELVGGFNQRSVGSSDEADYVGVLAATFEEGSSDAPLECLEEAKASLLRDIAEFEGFTGEKFDRDHPVIIHDEDWNHPGDWWVDL
jgi:hypothetical protein